MRRQGKIRRYFFGAASKSLPADIALAQYPALCSTPFSNRGQFPQVIPQRCRMKTVQITRFAQAAFIAFFAGVVSCVLTMALAPPPNSQHSAPPAEPSSMQQMQFNSIADAITRIEAQVQDLNLVRPSEHARREPVTDLPAGDGLARVMERLDDFERRMASFGLVRAHAAEKPVQRSAPNDWTALDELHSWNERDEDDEDDGARKSVALLTLPEVIDRFGTPSEVFGYDGQLRLYFHKFGPTGEVISTVEMGLTSGYVSGLDSHCGPD